MKFQVIGILVKNYIGNKSQYISLIMICLVGIILSTFPIGWDRTLNSVTLFNLPLELYGRSREGSLLGLLDEFFSWAWVIIAIFYLPSLLKKLNESFSVNEMLWLRLLPCHPYEVAIARVCWVVGWASLLGILGTVWALICSSFHQVPYRELLINVEGLVSHVILSGGIIVALDFVVNIRELEQNLTSVIALLFPLLLTPIYLGINEILDVRYMGFFPYVIPFNRGLQNTFGHFATAALIGLILLFIHAALMFKFSLVKVDIEE